MTSTTGWTCNDAETMEWDGTLKAKKFKGDGSELGGITATLQDAYDNEPGVQRIINVDDGALVFNMIGQHLYLNAQVMGEINGVIHIQIEGVDVFKISSEGIPGSSQYVESIGWIPMENATYDLGKVGGGDRKWRHLYLSGKIYQGIAGSETLKIEATGAITSLADITGANVYGVNINASFAVTTAHIAATSNPHSAVLSQTNIESSGIASFALIHTTGDQTASNAIYAPAFLYGTNAAPPTASGFPIGSIYTQYTP